MKQLNVKDRISYSDEHGTRTGSIIEIDEKTNRARIQWDAKRPRTWIRFAALVKLSIILFLSAFASCKKEIIRETKIEYVPTSPCFCGYKILVDTGHLHKLDSFYFPNIVHR